MWGEESEVGLDGDFDDGMLKTGSFKRNWNITLISPIFEDRFLEEG